MIYGNSDQRAATMRLLSQGERVLCLAGDRFLGKSSFLREELPAAATDSDLLFAEPGADGAREACAFARSEPVHGDAKFLVVEDADGMSDAAQDAYLKLLEEPPPSLRIVLTSADPSSMHPAFTSRLRRTVRWGPLPDSDMRGFASTIDPLDEDLLSMVRGRPGLYSRTHGKKYYKDLYATVLAAVAARSDPFMEPIPDAIDRMDEPADRAIVSYLCRFAALGSGGSAGRVGAVLRFCSTLSVPGLNASVHWMRMASDLLAL